jgi:hypothetical protein
VHEPVVAVIDSSSLNVSWAGPTRVNGVIAPYRVIATPVIGSAGLLLTAVTCGGGAVVQVTLNCVMLGLAPYVKQTNNFLQAANKQQQNPARI